MNMIKLKQIVENVSQDHDKNSVICPFCKEGNFDLAGLKNHLEHGDCEVYNNIASLPRLF